METIILRRWPDGQLIALFPNIAATQGLIQAYEHIGQHGAADYMLVIGKTLPVSYSRNDPERDVFIKELKQIGYTPRFRRRRVR
jgi:hypothetical protein